ncbi:DoxX family protein [Sediminibacterium sp. KACHI17]|jgi:hypothetical protein
MKRSIIFSWILRLLAAIILLQTLFFKFTAAEESVFIFTEMGIEPWGRIATGIAELITALFILYRPTLFIGAIFGVGIMTGALLSHIIVLGIEIQQDGGQLFIYAAVVWISCMILSIMHRQQLITLLERITGKNVKGK